jgi:hypothetical protein
LLRQFAEAYANGASVPRTELGEPKTKLRLIPPSDIVAHSFPLAVESARRAYALAHADGLSLSGVMRRFVVDLKQPRFPDWRNDLRSRDERALTKPAFCGTGDLQGTVREGRQKRNPSRITPRRSGAWRRWNSAAP